eukprot:6200789-Pleurochrysis_carterae.AAC.1
MGRVARARSCAVFPGPTATIASRKALSARACAERGTYMQPVLMLVVQLFSLQSRIRCLVRSACPESSMQWCAQAAQRRSALQESKFAVRQAAIGADPDETFSPRLITRSSRERRSHSVDGTELAGAQKFGSVAPSRREIARRLAAEARVRCP